MAWPPPPPPRNRDGVGWTLVPLLTAGIGAPASFAHAAVRLRSPMLGGCAALYGAGVVGSFFLMFTGEAGYGWLLFLLSWVASTSHAMVSRQRLYPRQHSRDQLNRQAVESVRQRRSLREAARRIAADDPGLAHELRIGRPDLLPRAFDDGGLVDVNHASPQALLTLPGLTYEMVDRIVRIRSHQGGFVSAEEVALHADLPPQVVPGLTEYAIFLS